MKAKTLKTLTRQIEAHKARIAKERDKLRDLIDDACVILDSCQEAEDCLVNAVDSLSQYL